MIGAIVQSLEQLEDSQTAHLDAEGVAVLEDTLARISQLYLQHGQLPLAIDASRTSTLREAYPLLCASLLL